MAAVCFFCKRSSNRNMEDISSCTMTTSKKSAKVVLMHLANLVKIKLELKCGSLLCKLCIDELQSYDTLMVNLLEVQDTLAQKLRETVMFATKRPQIDEQKTSLILDNIFAKTENGHEITRLDKASAALEATTPDTNASERSIGSPTAEDILSSDDDYNSSESLQNDSSANQISQSITIPSLRPEQQCNGCNEKFKSKRALEGHIKRVHRPNAAKCPICNVTRKHRDLLELHMNIHEGKTELECRYCDKTFSRSCHTLDHMRKHWNRLNYQCERCGERFAQEGPFRMHRKVHEAEENPLICRHCNFRCKTSKSYKNHLMTHRPDRPRFPCLRCSKSFTERYTLKVHMQTHGETLPYLKGRRRQKQNEEDGLERNLAISTSVPVENQLKPNTSEEKEPMDYVCTICESRLASRNQLNKHLKSEHDVIIT